MDKDSVAQVVEVTQSVAAGGAISASGQGNAGTSPERGDVNDS